MKVDGIFTNPKQHGAWVTEVDETVQSIRYRAIYRQFAVQFRRQPFGLVCPINRSATLVDETNPRPVGGGIVEWERIFAPVPPSRDEYESFVMAYQIEQSVDGKNTIGEIAIPVTSRTHYDYFYVPSGLYSKPSNIPKLEAYKLIQYVPDVIIQRGANPGPGASEMLAEDSQVTRWMGNIYQRKERYVPVPTFSVLT